MKYRMYFFVPYNISPIQQAIQAGHAALEYAFKYYNPAAYDEFISFMKNDKTWIILNGGTTNKNFTTEDGFPPQRIGSLNAIMDNLEEKGIQYSFFEEPDLNDALTAVCFLADERVWDFKTYPDLADYILHGLVMSDKEYITVKSMRKEQLIEEFPGHYKKWKKLIGGESNEFLRDLIRGKKLA